jgi:hypothetical protein
VLCSYVLKKNIFPLPILNYDDVVMSHENWNFHLHFFVEDEALHAASKLFWSQSFVDVVFSSFFCPETRQIWGQLWCFSRTCRGGEKCLRSRGGRIEFYGGSSGKTSSLSKWNTTSIHPKVINTAHFNNRHNLNPHFQNNGNLRHTHYKNLQLMRVFDLYLVILAFLKPLTEISFGVGG